MQQLVDTSIWADHFRQQNETLQLLLDHSQVVIHHLVIGELAMGHVSPRKEVLRSLDMLPKVRQANDLEVREFIEQHKLFGSGIGYVDAHLLASARISQVALWTRDKRLHTAAACLDLAP